MQNFFVEEANTLWVANKGKGIFRITLTEGLDSIMSLKNYNNESLSNNNNSFITRINRKIVVAAHEGLYYYDQIMISWCWIHYWNSRWMGILPILI